MAPIEQQNLLRSEAQKLESVVPTHQKTLGIKKNYFAWGLRPLDFIKEHPKGIAKSGSVLRDNPDLRGNQ